MKCTKKKELWLTVSHLMLKKVTRQISNSKAQYTDEHMILFYYKESNVT